MLTWKGLRLPSEGGKVFLREHESKVDSVSRSTTANPFSTGGNWYRGSVHNHTVASDGSHSVAELCRWYQDHGMHFVVITDHNVVADVSEARGLDITLLPGAEIAVCWNKAFGAEILSLSIDAIKRPVSILRMSFMTFWSKGVCLTFHTLI